MKRWPQKRGHFYCCWLEPGGGVVAPGEPLLLSFPKGLLLLLFPNELLLLPNAPLLLFPKLLLAPSVDWILPPLRAALAACIWSSIGL